MYTHTYLYIYIYICVCIYIYIYIPKDCVPVTLLLLPDAGAPVMREAYCKL